MLSWQGYHVIMIMLSWCLWIFDKKVIFLVVLKCNKIQKCIWPCENFNFVTKILRNFVIFREKIQNKNFMKFCDSEISSTTLHISTLKTLVTVSRDFWPSFFSSDKPGSWVEAVRLWFRIRRGSFQKSCVIPQRQKH
jgi:hypothetical protein